MTQKQRSTSKVYMAEQYHGATHADIEKLRQSYDDIYIEDIAKKRKYVNARVSNNAEFYRDVRRQHKNTHRTQILGSCMISISDGLKQSILDSSPNPTFCKGWV